jgi:16S rRNA processing protein RimM
MEIGLILGAFGIKGEVKILSLTDEPERFLELEALEIAGPDEEKKTYEVIRVRIHKGHAIVLLKGVPDRSAAEALKRSYVHLTGDRLTRAEQSRTDPEQLIGLEVYTGTGEKLGVLEEVIRTGANDVYEVRDGQKSILLPAISEVIKEVDPEHGRMVVDLLPGLL